MAVFTWKLENWCFQNTPKIHLSIWAALVRKFVTKYFGRQSGHTVAYTQIDEGTSKLYVPPVCSILPRIFKYQAAILLGQILVW